MFFLGYVYRELRRRMGRTVLTVLGFAVGVALVVSITALSAGLDKAQSQILDPLGSVGTDLIVTMPVELPDGNQTQSLLGGSGIRDLDLAGTAKVLEENQQVITDLSKLGKPGEEFERDFFLPANYLTFPASDAGKLAGLDGVTKVSHGLTLLGYHQEGEVPEIVAEIQTGGERIDINERIAPPTRSEQNAMADCIERGLARGSSLQNVAGSCVPQRLLRYSQTYFTKVRTIQQVVDPPETNISNEPYTIAGVDLSEPGVGLITPAQITEGVFFTQATGGKSEVILSDGYAKRKGLERGETITINKKSYTIKGLAKPPLGGQASDVYLPLDELRRISERPDRSNVLLVRAADAKSVAPLVERIQTVMPDAQITSAEDIAERITGSLVDAASLANRLGLLLAIVALVGAFLIASLLTLSSVAKRVRELGTLKAIGWRQALVVRQVVGESLAQGGMGGVLGAGLGVVAALAISTLAPSFSATAAPLDGPSLGFGLGEVGAGAATEQVVVSAPVDGRMLLLGVGLAILGGLIAGAVGALRAARLRPADALRELG